MVAKVLEVLGEKTLGGYDIGCSFETTSKNSSLGPKMLEKNARFCVPAFHSYTHNHLCQLQYHPSIIKSLVLGPILRHAYHEWLVLNLMRAWCLHHLC